LLFATKTRAQDEFITTWEIPDDSRGITIQTNSDFTYNYDVDWGDGTTPSNHTGGAIHSYGAAGTYTVKITGTFPAIYFNNVGVKLKIQSIEQWGNISWQSMENAFYGCTNLSYNATDAPDLSNVTSTRMMFAYCTDFDGDLSSWDMSNVNNLSGMFLSASAYNNGDVPLNWTSGFGLNAEMERMFGSATAFNQCSVAESETSPE